MYDLFVFIFLKKLCIVIHVTAPIFSREREDVLFFHKSTFGVVCFEEKQSAEKTVEFFNPSTGPTQAMCFDIDRTHGLFDLVLCGVENKQRGTDSSPDSSEVSRLRVRQPPLGLVSSPSYSSNSFFFLKNILQQQLTSTGDYLLACAGAGAADQVNAVALSRSLL
jgi:hypothetical protein